MLVDSHCHLDYEILEKDFDSVIKEAKEFGVEYLQTICTKISEFDKILEISKRDKNIFCSVGVHPCNVKDEGVYKAAEIIKLTEDKKVIGIGETGLDYYHETESKKQQIESFKEHIKASQETGLPVIIHTRDAEEDTLEILQEMMALKKFPALIHCFTASKKFAQEVLKLDLYISISGIITFKNAKDLQEIAKTLPLNRILVETDSPYLAPVPKRGKSNRPAYTKYTAEFLSELLEVDYDILAKKTTENFFSLFSKALL